ncbi:MAG: hypothetical protein ACE5E4_09470 [Candidatus Binatia bacterium]
MGKVQRNGETATRHQETNTVSCPLCGTDGRPVASLTVRSLLRDAAMDRFDGTEGFFFCRSANCDLVFFHGRSAARFSTASVDVVVFQKSTDPDRLVCYCYGHSVREINDEVARTGSSRVPEKVVEKCRRGLQRCEEMNPQGSCCLRNVRQIVKAALARSDASTDARAPNEREPSAAPVGPTEPSI